MAIIRKKLDNLKPGKQYILTVRTKNNDINTVANLSESIRFTVPQDGTIPDTITNLQLYASFEKVMFVFNFSSELDISRYEYELYSDPNIEVATPPLVSTGFNAANVFTVSVPNSYTESVGEGFNTVARSYWGRVRGIDTTGNAGPWTTLVQTDEDTPLIDNQYIDNLTASKITAGTIGAHTIQLNGANSILKSSNYSAGTAGWIIKGDGSAEFRNVSIGGNSTIDGLDVDALEDAIANFNNRNDRISTVPANPGMVASPLSIQHTLNNGGSANVSFDWTYDGTGDAYNIDGFFLYVKSATTSGGIASAAENVYALTSEKRAAILYGVPADHFYSFSVQAYRIVDNDINSTGILKSAAVASPQNPYRPTENIAFNGNITGTLNNVPISQVIANANSGATVSQNFFTNNDQNNKIPDAPTLLTDGTAIDHTLNGDGSVDISFEWDYPLLSDVWDNKNNIDGFIVSSYSSVNSASYITLPGSTGNYASIPDNSAIDLAGDIDIRVRVALNNFATGTAQTLVSKWTDLGSNNRSWILRISATNRLELLTSANGSSFLTHTSSIAPSLTNGTTYWIRATIDVADGANRTVRFFVNTDSTSEPTSWTPLGDPVPGDPPGNTVLFNSAANLTVGCHNASFNGLAPGKYYRVILRNGIGGPAVADLDFTRVSTTTQTSLTAITGQTITLFRSGSPSLTATPGSYVITGDSLTETNYYIPRSSKAFVLPGVASDRFYTFGVRAYRMVDSNVASPGLILSPIAQVTTAGNEYPYKPEATVAFAGNILGTIGGVPAPTIIDNANQGLLVAQNYFSNNDQNTITPTTPGIPTGGTAIDHVENDNATVDISFEWTYTTSVTPSDANNIDGFIVSIYSSDPGATPSPTTYVMGSNPNLETNYYIPPDRRSIFLQGVASNRYYTFGVRAYRIVDSIISATPTGGIVISPYAQSSESGENPYRPSANVAYRGSLSGTIGGTPTLLPAADIVNGIYNFNTNNDRIGVAPGAINTGSLSFSSSNNLTGTIDLGVAWGFTATGDAGNIDGFIVYLRTTDTSDASAITTADLSTNIQQAYLTAERRAHFFSGVDPAKFYRFAVRAFRVVDQDVYSAFTGDKAGGVIYGPLLSSSERNSNAPIIGGNTGIEIGNGKIYIGTGTFEGTTTGFYVDADGNLSLKNKLSWNNTTEVLKITGEIISSSGTIGGFTIGATLLSAGSTTSYVGVSSGGTHRFWAGAETPASAPFSVSNAGVLTASGATLTGSFASFGATGNVQVNSGQLVLAHTSGIPNESTVPKISFSSSVSNIMPGILQSTGYLVLEKTGTSYKIEIGFGGTNFEGIYYTVPSTKRHYFYGLIEAYDNILSPRVRGGTDSSGFDLKTAGGFARLAHSTKTADGDYVLASSGGTSFVRCESATTLQFVQGSTTLAQFATNGDFHPLPDNTYKLGWSGGRWSAVWAATGTIQTSDIRTKTDIQDSTLGLSFIQQLRPVQYRYIVGGNEVVSSEWNQETQEYDCELQAIPGARLHAGLIAQEVKNALESVEAEDFGGWILTDKDDPDSEQALRYEEFISPIIKAIQELSSRIEAIETRLE